MFQVCSRHCNLLVARVFVLRKMIYASSIDKFWEVLCKKKIDPNVKKTFFKWDPHFYNTKSCLFETYAILFWFLFMNLRY